MGMANLYIPVGIPGCGKSTLVEKILPRENLVVVSTDAIREELHPGIDFIAEFNGRVFDIFHQRIGTALSQDQHVAADATNLEYDARKRLRVIADLAQAKTHVIVFKNVHQAVIRNRRRGRVVPADAMMRMIDQYSQALINLPTEVYTSTTYIVDGCC